MVKRLLEWSFKVGIFFVILYAILSVLFGFYSNSQFGKYVGAAVLILIPIVYILSIKIFFQKHPMKEKILKLFLKQHTIGLVSIVLVIMFAFWYLKYQPNKYLGSIVLISIIIPTILLYRIIVWRDPVATRKRKYMYTATFKDLERYYPLLKSKKLILTLILVNLVILIALIYALSS